MFYLFAQAATNPISTTIDAAALADKLGPPWFFVVLCFAAFALVVFGVGYGIYKLGGRLMDRLDSFLTGIQQAALDDANTLKTHMIDAKSARVNIGNLVEAGHGFANAVQKIGKEMGVDVSVECDKIHDKLRATQG